MPWWALALAFGATTEGSVMADPARAMPFDQLLPWLAARPTAGAVPGGLRAVRSRAHPSPRRRGGPSLPG